MEEKSFSSYVVPSVLSFALTGIYCLVDAFFVGNKVGDIGLAAINIAFSLMAIMQAVGSGVGLGASVRYSICTAQGKEKAASSYIGASFWIMTGLGVLIAVPMLLIPRTLMLALGASDNIADIGAVYMRILAAGTLLQVWGTGYIPIVRNCGGSFLSMVAVVGGCVFNIFLDWLFVWVLDMGISGAAWATLLGQTLTLIICIIYLLIKGKITFRCSEMRFLSVFKEIVGIGISPFGLTMVPNISVVILNKACLAYGGERALGAYGCMAYLVYIIYLLIQGVGDGSQPLVSSYYGAQYTDSLNRTVRLTFITSLAVALGSFLLEFFLRFWLGPFMGASADVTQVIARGLPVFAVGFFFIAVSRTCASCLYATERNLRSYIISYCEPVFILVFVLTLPLFLGLDGVWLANTAGQLCVMVLSIILYRK